MIFYQDSKVFFNSHIYQTLLVVFSIFLAFVIQQRVTKKIDRTSFAVMTIQLSYLIFIMAVAIWFMPLFYIASIAGGVVAVIVFMRVI